MKNDELLHKWIEGTISDEELEAFKLRPEYESLVNLHRQTENLTTPSFDQYQMLTEIMATPKAVVEPLPVKRRTFLSTAMKFGLAAAALLLIGIFIWMQGNNQVSYIVEKGSVQNGQLPDQSTFVLNAESELSYDNKKWKKERLIHLSGEAYFEVTKGSAFTVATELGTVKVLGTHFNVKVRNNILEVSCQEGKVGIQSKNGGEQTTISGNEAVRIVDGVLGEKWKQDTGAKASWVDGIFRFRNVSLQTVLDELERQYVIKINGQQVDTKAIISCNFQRDNMVLALRSALTPLGIKYRKVDAQLIELYK